MTTGQARRRRATGTGFRVGRRLRCLPFVAAVLLAGLGGCADSGLPGMSFPGGPSPWLPAGAPSDALAPAASTRAVPAPATGLRPLSGGSHTVRASGRAGWQPALRNR